ncbi:MAG: RlmE family RNA methyltransferase [Thaumarchaeota archaeon]|nr:RlmE family RNA methyltransferase [Nitrososphaerota archaeon]
MRLDEARRDLYRRLAREQGYKSRAAFKLIESNERYGFLRPGGKVLDLGAAPGGWMQVAAELVGPSGLVVGVDLDKIRLREKNVVSLKMDVHDPGLVAKVEPLLGGKADVILSDLAPSVSGVWEIDQGRQVDLTLRVLEIARALLGDRGSVFCKLFEGERSQFVRDEFRRLFTSVRTVKPAASRNASSELYYFCEGMKKATVPSD